jgi:serine/threonine protein kinase
MSPEQARGKDVDERTDVWAYGCCLYEALAGCPAFRGETTADTLARILEREPPWEALPEHLPPSIQQLLRRCLEKDRDRRLHSMGKVHFEIEEALAGPTFVRSSPRPIAVLPFLNLSADAEQEEGEEGGDEGPRRPPSCAPGGSRKPCRRPRGLSTCNSISPWDTPLSGGRM